VNRNVYERSGSTLIEG